MDFDFTSREEAFRAEVRAFLDENLPPPEERGPPSKVPLRVPVYENSTRSPFLAWS